MADLRQNAQRTERNKKKSRKGGWWWLVIVIVVAFTQMADTLDLSGLQRLWWRYRVTLLRHGVTFNPAILLLAVLVLLIILIYALCAALKKRRAEKNKPAASGRTSAAVQRRDPRTASFTRPEPTCIVCDHTGEDHFQHDKEQRIRQLDDWLKNGLVDKDEYRVLKARYEQDL